MRAGGESAAMRQASGTARSRWVCPATGRLVHGQASSPWSPCVSRRPGHCRRPCHTGGGARHSSDFRARELPEAAGCRPEPFHRQDIALPWAVEPNPVRVDDGSGVFHVLLQRKETGFVCDRGSLDSAILKSVQLYFATDGRSGARRSDGASLRLKSLEGYFGRERHANGDAADPG